MRPVIVRSQAPEEYTREFPEYTPVIVQLLYNRNILRQEDVDAFLDPQYHESTDPFLFNDMSRACERIYAAIRDKELIAVHGDYDADGVAASVLLQNTLEKLGAKTIVFLPHRDKDGYGLNLKSIEYLREQGTRLIITCDCGISNAPEIAHASALGIDTIVTDHHQIPKNVPLALAIIHPKIEGETYPFKELAGGGVAFKLAQGLLASPSCPLLQSDREAFEKWLLDLVAISTVADMVELLGENRLLVKYGLLVMSKNRRLGLEHMFKQARIDAHVMTAETVAYQVAPRINAAGRMDHANTAYMLLRSTNAEEADLLARKLEQQNKDRQRISELMYRDAVREEASQSGSVRIFFNKQWSAGLTGLLAGKLSKKLNKPVFVMGFDGERIAGSGRSPAGISIMDGIILVKDHLLSYGGHPHACGFRMDESVREHVCVMLRRYYDSVLPQDMPEQPVIAEAEISFSMIGWDLTDYVRLFEPFGQGNSEPLFYTRSVVIESVKRVGQKLNHLKMVLSHNGIKLPAIAFGVDDQEFDNGSLIDIVYAVTVNQWNGNRELQLKVQSLFPTV